MHHTCDSRPAGIACFVARTGYTGELGYEIYVPASKAADLWDATLENGRSQRTEAGGARREGFIPLGNGLSPLWQRHR